MDHGEKPEGRGRQPLGFGARDVAVAILTDVFANGHALDDAMQGVFKSSRGFALEPRDRALARLIAVTAMRRRGAIEAVLQTFMEKPLAPKYAATARILLAGATQLLYLDTPPHAAVSIAVAQCRRHPSTARFDKLVNAVLRRVSLHGKDELAGIDATRTCVPEWLWSRWEAAYGADVASRIAAASLSEPPLDLTVKLPQDIALWAGHLAGVKLATGSIRTASGGRIEELAGYAEGTWWVQDAAAAIPALLFGTVLDGRTIADLCAAPGGKTAQLAAAGATVIAVDISERRLERLHNNLQRLGLQAERVTANIESWEPGRMFDGVLLDAPCSATGTLRRHPDILHGRRNDEIAELVALQARLLNRAADWVKPGGTLVYCTCSLEPEEGERQIAWFLTQNTAFRRRPVIAGESGIDAAWLTPDGDLRTLPCHTPAGDKDERGMDGFFAARIERLA